MHFAPPVDFPSDNITTARKKLLCKLLSEMLKFYSRARARFQDEHGLRASYFSGGNWFKVRRDPSWFTDFKCATKVSTDFEQAIGKRWLVPPVPIYYVWIDRSTVFRTGMSWRRKGMKRVARKCWSIGLSDCRGSRQQPEMVIRELPFAMMENWECGIYEK